MLVLLGTSRKRWVRRATVSGWTIEVLAVEHHAITSVCLRRGSEGSGQEQIRGDLEGDGDQGVDPGGDHGQ
nr:hypothetical protein [Saccharothrix sp. NRRL B-16314]